MNFEIVLATNNKHKLKEVRDILSPHGITVYGLQDVNIKVPEVEETGRYYAENALLKAQSIQPYTSLPIIADDSGLEVVALNSEPGLNSARYAITCGGHSQAMLNIIKRLEDYQNRSARFVCAIILLNVENRPLIFEGIAEGSIATQPIGDGGFGYDPIFVLKDGNRPMGLMTEIEKNQVSHRAKALKKLLTYLKINGHIPFKMENDHHH
jgi:XTP/dITP diphosphohydrolase